MPDLPLPHVDTLLSLTAGFLEKLSPAARKAKLKQLSDSIAHHSNLYYNHDAPTLSDADFDRLKQTWDTLSRAFGAESEGLAPSPVGAPVKATGARARVQHLAPLYSLDNAFHMDDAADFVGKMNRFLRQEADLAFVAEPKIDGLSVALLYEKGVLLRAATRGDGRFGEDITANIKTLNGLPHTLSLTDPIEIRGEVFLENKAFLALNADQESQGLEAFANPRNAAAGSVRHLDPNVTAARPLKFKPHGFHGPGPLAFHTYLDVLAQLRTWGFDLNEHKLCGTLDDIRAYQEDLSIRRHAFAFDIDGTVFKLNDLNLWNRLGHNQKAPRFAFAFKFDPEIATTVLEDISLQVGRLGTLTPVAHLAPVNIGGVLVTRASLHNADELERQDLRIGDTVQVKRAGDVIPQVLGPLKDKRPAGTTPFVFPKICPSCKGPIQRVENQVAWRCQNGAHCPAQAIWRLRHFASRPALDIDGIGKNGIALFFEKGWLKTPNDFFTLQQRQENGTLGLESLVGWGDKSMQNLWDAIRRAQTPPLNRFIYALGIPGVGAATADLLAQNFKTIDAFMALFDSPNETAAERNAAENPTSFQETLEAIHGIGPLVAKDIGDFFQDPGHQNWVKRLLNHVQPRATEPPQSSAETALSGKTLVFTGTLPTLSRAEATALAKKAGALVTSSLSSKTAFLVAGDAAGSKLSKAEKLGVTILDEATFKGMLHPIT